MGSYVRKNDEMIDPNMREYREAFEAFAKAEGGYNLQRSELRRDWYSDFYTQAAWLAYQAASAAATARAVEKVRAIPTYDHGWNTLSYAQGVNKAIEVIEGLKP